MNLDATQIMQLVKDKEAELTELHTQMDEDFDLFTLAKYESESGYQSYTSSQPRNFFDKVIDAVNKSEISIQIKLSDEEALNEKKRNAASTGELFLFGALNTIDRNLRRRGEPSLKESLGFYESLRGWMCLRALVYIIDGETVFDVLPWDILHITWESGAFGHSWVNNKRKLSAAQIKSEYNKEIKGKSAELLDFFDEVNNSIIIGDEFVKEPEPHGLKHPPIFIGAVGSMPTIQGKGFTPAIKYRGDSVWAASRSLYEPFNRVTSRTMDLYERAIIGSIIHTSKRGDKSIPGDPYKTYQEVKISTDDEEEILPFPSPILPPETAVLHSIINTDIQTSTLPYPLAYGGTRQAMSGAALSVLSDATRSVYSPRTGLMAQCYTWLCEELLLQFKDKGIKTALSGYDQKENFFTVKVKPKDIDPSWYVSVDVSPKMPRDMESEIMMSLAATARKSPEDIPLLSKRTAREDILKIRDPDAEENRALVEMGMGLPPIMATQIAAALKKAGNDNLAQDVMMLLNPPRQQGGQLEQPGAVTQQGQQGGQSQQGVMTAVQLVEMLAQNPQTAPIAQAIIQVMGPPRQQGQSPQGQPPGAVPPVI